MSSRDRILGKLRQPLAEGQPFPAVGPLDVYQPMVPPGEATPAALRARFVREAQQAACVLHEVQTPPEAIAAILKVIGEDAAISAWDPALIPVPGLEQALDEARIRRVGQDASVRVGLTGVEAALAATGSIIVASGNGRWRTASLLPPVHIAVLTADQILPDLESWLEGQKAAGLEQKRRHSNIAIITGPSRTADIAMQLVMGMHGPRELQLVLLHHS